MQLSYELILVDDRCPKRSWEQIKLLGANDASVKGLRLSRNFGQHAAIQAGLSTSRGEWVVVMDCDLQDLPEEIPALLEKARLGFDIVRARRVARNDAWHRRAISNIFYHVLSFLTGTDQNSEVANFGVYHRKVVDAIISWSEQTKYLPAIIQWIGFERAEVEVSHGVRRYGTSSYTLRKLLVLASDVIVGFSDRPLKIVMGTGFIVAVFSFLVSIGVLAVHLVGLVSVEGWTSVILSLWFLSGCMAFSLGLAGLYIGRILTEVKGRPVFIIDEELNLDSSCYRLTKVPD